VSQKKIIYLIEQPLSRWNYDRFGIQRWRERGWRVEVWDLTRLLNPSLVESDFNLDGPPPDFDGLYIVAKNNELTERFNSLFGGEYYMGLFGEDAAQVRIMARFSRLGAKRIWSYLGCFPTVPLSSAELWRRRIKRWVDEGFYQFFLKISGVIYRKLYKSKIIPELVVVSGERSVPFFASANEIEIINAHNLDYDIYLELKDKVTLAENKYLVFIDQNLCFHTDFNSTGVNVGVSPKKYFPAICKIINEVSINLFTDPVVAAHPRFNPNQVCEYFSDIPVIYGDTAKLIRDSYVVIGHHSVAIQFAVLFSKPVIFLTSDEINNTETAQSIEKLASELGKQPINIDRDLSDIDWEGELSVDQERYTSYIGNYIKMRGSDEKPAWDIVIDHLEKSLISQSKNE